MATYKTPGVYVEEISTLPPSVVPVATAVPAFIGYTEKGPTTPTRISSMVEYEDIFGGAFPAPYTITNDPADPSFSLDNPTVKFILYPCLRLYFLNGGGPCYIVSVGNYDADTPAKAAIEGGITAIQKVDEPTILLLPDAVNIDADDPSQYYLLCQEILSQCAMLKDRFGIFDIPAIEGEGHGATDPKIVKFRDMIGANNLSYGAAYTPYLNTGIPYAYDESGVSIPFQGTIKSYDSDPTNKNGILVSFIDNPTPSIEINANGVLGIQAGTDGKLVIKGIDPGTTTAAEISDKWSGISNGFNVVLQSGKDDDTLSDFPATALTDHILGGYWLAASGTSQMRIAYLGDTPAEEEPLPKVQVTGGGSGSSLDVQESQGGESEDILTITLDDGGNTIEEIIDKYTDEVTSNQKFVITRVNQNDPSIEVSSSTKIDSTVANDTPINLIPIVQTILIGDAEESTNKGLLITYEDGGKLTPKVEVVDGSSEVVNFQIDSNDNKLTINVKTNGSMPADIVSAWNKYQSDKHNFVIQTSGDGSTVVEPSITATLQDQTMTLDVLKSSNTHLYNAIKAKLDANMMTLPPSSAMAGIYAQVDGSRGVWKAPANVSVNGILGPAETITAADQEGLNIDATSGKSINVIRNFTGKGTLVWGARTLDGNSNEWRYISVRRLFITVEESVQKACAFAVFEPNDATTWLKVKAMIDNYLYGLWQQGALAGSKPAAAYFVNVGLGKTMTTEDILNGYMIVDVGIAAVRPAEFIVLRFSQKLQEA